MNLALPTGRRGQALALGLALAVLAVAYAVIAVPLCNVYASRTAEIENKGLLLVKLNAIAGELPKLEARRDELRTGMDSHKLTLEGASDAIASANLQGRIEELAAAAGVKIGSTESLTAEAQGAYRRLGLRVVINGPYQNLVELLAKIEQAIPPLIVDNLQVHAFQRRPGAPAAALTEDATMEVYGFRVGEASDVAAQ